MSHDRAWFSCSLCLSTAWSCFLRSPTSRCFWSKHHAATLMPLPPAPCDSVPCSSLSHQMVKIMSKTWLTPRQQQSTSGKSGIPHSARETQVETADSPWSGGRCFKAPDHWDWQKCLLFCTAAIVRKQNCLPNKRSRDEIYHAAMVN